MKSSTLYLRVGALVVVGALLAVGFVFFLAGNRNAGPTVTFETYSRESVQGLDVGAPVRYRGVAVGRVSEIGLVSAEYRRPEGTPYTEAFRLVFVRFVVDTNRVGETPRPEEAIRLGLRARITAQGITGVNYVELDFVDPARFPAQPVPWTPRYPVVPSIPSTVEQVRSAAETLMQRLSEVPLDQIMSNLNELLAALRQQAAGGDAATILNETARTAELLRKAVQDGDIAQTLADLRGAADAARELLAGNELREAVTNISATAAELRRAAAALPGTLAGLDRTLRTVRDTTQDVQADLLPILENLRSVTSNLRATTQQLRNSPSQTLFGAPPPPPERRR
ncbi:MlaD family protein [Roseomonas sp. AR75]|uniref:MlaD family protein n=1 Tax=Roseomonas sp. AR75 TaxID=2562311 RepID=UPI0010C135AE|nr:MlaD family protein [Roseomonas sp. AR75]